MNGPRATLTRRPFDERLDEYRVKHRRTLRAQYAMLIWLTVLGVINLAFLVVLGLPTAWLSASSLVIDVAALGLVVRTIRALCRLRPEVEALRRARDAGPSIAIGNAAELAAAFDAQLLAAGWTREELSTGEDQLVVMPGNATWQLTIGGPGSRVTGAFSTFMMEHGWRSGRYPAVFVLLLEEEWMRGRGLDARVEVARGWQLWRYPELAMARTTWRHFGMRTFDLIDTRRAPRDADRR
jgi:hypothetical protein